MLSFPTVRRSGIFAGWHASDIGEFEHLPSPGRYLNLESSMSTSAWALQQSVFDDVTEIGFSDFGCIEQERSAGRRRDAFVPYAHALVRADAMSGHRGPGASR